MATSDNLKEAFAGESQANRRYTAFARQAQVENMPMIAKLFRATADAETIHALMHLRVMGGVRRTPENLREALSGESYEYTKMYPQFLAQAKSEGNKAAALTFNQAMQVEEIHHDLYNDAIKAIDTGKDMADSAIFVCSVCGNTVLGQAPDICPICGAVKEKFFEVR